MSQICLNKRNAGLEIVQKILNSLPEIDANWLLKGKGNMTIDRSGKSVSVQDSPQATISNGDMAINAPVELLNLLTSQQETIKRQKKKNVGRIIELRQTQNQPKDKVLARRLKTV